MQFLFFTSRRRREVNIYANSPRNRHSSFQPTGSLGDRKVTHWKRFSIGTGVGALGTAGLTAGLVVAIGLTATGIGVLIGGAVLTALFIAGSVASWKKAKAAMAGIRAQNKASLTPNMRFYLRDIDDTRRGEPFWSSENRDRLIQAMLDNPGHVHSLYSAARSISHQSSKSPLEQKQFDAILENPTQAEKLAIGFAKFKILHKDDLAKNCTDSLINHPDRADGLSEAFSFMDERGVRVTPERQKEVIEKPEYEKAYSMGFRNHLVKSEIQGEMALRLARIFAPNLIIYSTLEDEIDWALHEGVTDPLAMGVNFLSEKDPALFKRVKGELEANPDQALPMAIRFHTQYHQGVSYLKEKDPALLQTVKGELEANPDQALPMAIKLHNQFHSREYFDGAKAKVAEGGMPTPVTAIIASYLGDTPLKPSELDQKLMPAPASSSHSAAAAAPVDLEACD